MSNKKYFKEMFKNEFDMRKNYNQIIEKIEKKKNRQLIRMLKYSLTPICLLLVLGIAIVFNYKSNANLKPSNFLEKYNIEINEIKENIHRNDALKIDGDIKVLKKNNILELYSVTKQLSLPNELSLTDSYCLYVKDYNGNSKEEYMQIKEYTKLSGCHLIYSKTEKVINIAIAKGQNPLRDYYFENDNLKSSKINDIKTTIIKYKNYYWATFNKNDIYYDIESNNITIDELLRLIISITK